MRKCLLCQKEYKYCPYCAEDAYKPKWMFLFHDENCSEIFDVLQRHDQGFYTDEEAIIRLKSLDLTVLKNATENVKNQVKKILSKEVKEEQQEEVKSPVMMKNNTKKTNNRK